MSKFNFYFVKYFKGLDESGTCVVESLIFIAGTESWKKKQQGEVGLIFVFFFFRFSTFAMNRKTYFDIQNPIFWHWVGKSYFDIHNPILTLDLDRKILFCLSKSYFDIRTESENQNRILTFAVSRKILFWHSKSCFDIRYVGKSNFDIQNPLLTLAMSK